MDYVFTESNTIYAVPVECVGVERGGTNPFGTWAPVTENYWADGYNIKAEYGGELNPCVFNDKSYLYPYIVAYEEYLEKTLGVGDVKVGLITYDQLISLGCTSSSCVNTPDWVRTSAFWSGSAAGWSGIWVKHNGASFYGHNYKANDRVIRPVIEIPKEIINFN